MTFRLDAPVMVATDRAPQAFRYAEPPDYQRDGGAQGPPRYAGAAPAPYGYAAPAPTGYAAPYPYYPYPYYGPALKSTFGPGFYGRYYGGYRYRR